MRRIIVDTREPVPYTFQRIRHDLKDGGGLVVTQTIRKKLDTGDYSLEGFEGGVTVERKTVSDFVGCCTHDRDRFKECLKRMGMIDFPWVVVEGEVSAVMQFCAKRGQKHLAKCVFRTILSWQFKYTPQWLFLNGRREAEVATFRILQRFYSEYGSK